MAKHKRGLHKQISSIFGGVPIQKSNGAPQQPYAPAPDRCYDERPKANERPWGPPVPPKPACTEPKIPKIAEPQQPVQSPPKAAPTEQALAVHRTARHADSHLLGGHGEIV